MGPPTPKSVFIGLFPEHVNGIVCRTHRTGAGCVNLPSPKRHPTHYPSACKAVSSQPSCFISNRKGQVITWLPGLLASKLLAGFSSKVIQSKPKSLNLVT